MQFSFSGELIEWRGPAPFYFAAIPSSISAEIREDAKLLSYGWGVIPVRGLIGVTEFTTSLIPRDGVFLLPVKNAVRLPEKLQLGELISAEIELGAR
jgi:hypothetical protein